MDFLSVQKWRRPQTSPALRRFWYLSYRTANSIPSFLPCGPASSADLDRTTKIRSRKRCAGGATRKPRICGLASIQAVGLPTSDDTSILTPSLRCSLGRAVIRWLSLEYNVCTRCHLAGVREPPGFLSVAALCFLSIFRLGAISAAYHGGDSVNCIFLYAPTHQPDMRFPQVSHGVSSLVTYVHR